MNKKRGNVSRTKIEAIRQYNTYSTTVRFVKFEAIPLLEQLKNQNDKLLNKTITNYLIVRAVTIFENHHLNIANYWGDVNKFKMSELFNEVRIDRPLGEQVVSQFSFINPKDVNRVFSTLLDVDFFEKVKTESKQNGQNYSDESAHIKYTKRLHTNWESVLSIFEKRNQIVHRNKLFYLKYSELRDLIGGLMDFILYSLVIL